MGCQSSVPIEAQGSKDSHGPLKSHDEPRGSESRTQRWLAASDELRNSRTSQTQEEWDMLIAVRMEPKTGPGYDFQSRLAGADVKEAATSFFSMLLPRLVYETGPNRGEKFCSRLSAVDVRMLDQAMEMQLPLSKHKLISGDSTLPQDTVRNMRASLGTGVVRRRRTAVDAERLLYLTSDDNSDYFRWSCSRSATTACDRLLPGMEGLLDASYH